MNSLRITILSFGIAFLGGALSGCTGPSVSGGAFAIEPHAVEDQLDVNEGKTYPVEIVNEGNGVMLIQGIDLVDDPADLLILEGLDDLLFPVAVEVGDSFTFSVGFAGARLGS